MTTSPASRRTLATSWRAASRLAPRPVLGRNSWITPGRSACQTGSTPRAPRTDVVRGMETPAPSDDAPSAPKAPRWASAPRPRSASGSTSCERRPPASATKPIPHASCSNAGSYSGAAGRRFDRRRGWRCGGSLVIGSPGAAVRCVWRGSIDRPGRSRTVDRLDRREPPVLAASGAGLVGDLAVDGEIEAELLLPGRDSNTEDQVDDLHDHERRDDGIGDRRADRQDLGDDLAGVAIDQ